MIIIVTTVGAEHNGTEPEVTGPEVTVTDPEGAGVQTSGAGHQISQVISETFDIESDSDVFYTEPWTPG